MSALHHDTLCTLYLGDCVEVMRELPAESVDAVVTDPPYGLEFMGKEWDRLGEHWRTDRSPDKTGRGSWFGDNHDSPRYGKASRQMQRWHEAWAREAFRVAKPGAHLLAFGGTRTYHRLASAIEDAGWEIRDTLCWCYASGFPKSLAPYRSIMSGICPSHASAPHAVQVSAWHPHESPEGKEPTALALAETQPEGELLLLIRTGAAGASPAVTATLLSAFLRGDTNWNTAWSWDSYSAERWAKTSTFIIGLATRAITHQGIWNSLTLSRTPIATRAIESRPDGCKCAVLAVVESSTDGSVSTSSILWPSAHEPATSPLARLRGLGTAAKPAWEPIVMARKPLRGTVAANVLAHGTGALNIDATRIGTDGGSAGAGAGAGARVYGDGLNGPRALPVEGMGRWPANLLLTDPIFDGDTPGVVGGGTTQSTIGNGQSNDPWLGGGNWSGDNTYGDSGTYSRFFELPKGGRSGILSVCPICGANGAESSSTERTPGDPTAQLSAVTSPPESSDQDVSSAASQSGLWSTDSAPSPALTGESSGSGTGTAPPTTNGTGQPSSPDSSGSTSRTRPSRGSRRGRPSPTLDPASPAAPSATSSATTTTTPSQRWCDSCAADAMRSSMVEQESAERNYPWAFLIPKSSRSDREPVLRGQLEERDGNKWNAGGIGERRRQAGQDRRENAHPTVKPLDLMRHLVRLVTPPGGTVLDCFLGSGTTAIAANAEGFRCIGIEKEREYLDIALARMTHQPLGMAL